MTWRRLRVARGLRGFWPPRLVRCVGCQPPHHQPHQLACRQHHRPFVRVLPYFMHLPVIIGGLLRGCIRTVCAVAPRAERKYRLPVQLRLLGPTLPGLPPLPRAAGIRGHLHLVVVNVGQVPDRADDPASTKAPVATNCTTCCRRP